MASNEVKKYHIFRFDFDTYGEIDFYKLQIEVRLEADISSMHLLKKKTKDGIIFISDLTKEQKKYLGL
jgi:hypothetical protein